MPEFGDLWKEGVADRQEFIRRARRNAFLTHPYLAPPLSEEVVKNEDLPVPRQSVGADGVTNLASKLALSLFPPQGTFFRYEIDRLAFIENGGDPNRIEQVELALSQRAAAVQRRLDTGGFRVRLVEMLEHLIPTGSYVLRMTEDFRWRGYSIAEFVCFRDGNDDVEVLIVREVIDRRKLPAHLQNRVPPAAGSLNPNQVYLLTGNVREGKKWRTHQEAGGVVLPGTEGEYAADDFPWIVPRMVVKSGENYGRAYVDGIYGNLHSLEGLTQNLVEYSALASRCVGINPPSSMIPNKKLTSAENGDWLTGQKTDEMGFLTVDKLADVQTSVALREDVKLDLQRRFLLLNPVRNAERVTAEEIIRTTQELTETLGGAFTTFGGELQSPVARLVERQMVRRGELPPIEAKVAQPRVTTGLDALGRTRDELGLIQYAQTIQAVFGPEAATEILDASSFAAKLAAAKGYDPTGLVRSEEELAQRAAARSQQGLLEAAAPQLTQAASEAARRRAPAPPQT